MTPDSLAARLLAAFLEDLDEQVETLGTHLLVLDANPANAESLQAVFRVVHTLKGAARATGVTYIGEACHLLEERLLSARDGSRPLERTDMSLLFFANDALIDAARRLRAKQSLDDSPIAHLQVILTGQESLTAHSPSVTPSTSTPSPLVPSASAQSVVPPTGPNTPWTPSGPSADEVPTRLRDTHIRIAADKVDALIASGSQLLASRSRLTNRSTELNELYEFVATWAADWRIRGANVRRTLENSPAAKLVPLLDAFASNLTRLVQDTGRAARGVAGDANAFHGMIDTMFERVRGIRMRPFSDACTPLPRIARDESALLHKQVELVIRGQDVEADRGVLEAVREALLHLVRNAIDHGIEMPDVRQQAGKPSKGTIEVAATIAGDQLVVTVTDDGAGIDPAVVRSALQAGGLAVPIDDADVLRSLFLPGVSTREKATALSGRGVGLDAVEAATSKIGGTVAVTSVPGQGTTFTLECPLTLATIRALLVSVGEQLVAIPTSAIAQLHRAQPAEISRAEGRDVYVGGTRPIPVVSLARLLGPPLVEQRAAGAIPLVFVQGREGQLALAVDRLLNEEEIVVHPVARAGDSIPLLSGAAILGTGEIAFVVSISAVIQTGLETGAGGTPLVAPAQQAETRKRVLIVDDSITTRTLERSTVEAAGYDVTTAVDGSDAWRLLQQERFDLVVSDIEMPRMDGLLLCETIRASQRTQSLPVILVTALESPEQRMRGLEVGADAYIGKSTFDQQTLIDTIRQLIG
jgi:two-component system chemotaxis sensor kinase CheA